jgi:hypothetical protein
MKTLLSGLEMVVPVNVIAETANVCVYNSHITDETYILNGLLAYSVYKFDRYRDSQEIGMIRDNTTEFLLFSSIISTITMLFYTQQNVLLMLYLSTFMYKNIKRLDFPVKPFYVASLWAVTTGLDNIYVLPFWLNIFALTNLADITDTHEDLFENVTTLPTSIGKETTFNLCVASSIIATIAFTQLPYFENNILNDFFIFSNVVPYMNFTR